MPRVNLADVPDIEPLEPIPAGEYLCRLADVEVVQPLRKPEFWRPRWIVQRGPYKGRTIPDILYFSEKALPRVKLLCGVASLDTSEEIDLKPSDLLGMRAVLTVEEKQFEDKNGKTRRVNAVVYNGYGVPSDTEDDGAGADDDLGF